MSKQAQRDQIDEAIATLEKAIDSAFSAKSNLSELDDNVRDTVGNLVYDDDVTEADDDNVLDTDALFDAWDHIDTELSSYAGRIRAKINELKDLRKKFEEPAKTAEVPAPETTPTPPSPGTAVYRVDNVNRVYDAAYNECMRLAKNLPQSFVGCAAGLESVPFGRLIRNTVRWQIAAWGGGPTMDGHLRATQKVIQDILDGKLDLNATN